MPNPGKVLITFNVTPDQHLRIKAWAARKEMAVSKYIRSLIQKDMNIGMDATKPPIPKHVPEMDHYYCPICKSVLEETDRRDRIDTYGITHYHSMELQLECTSCKLGHGVILQFPYIDR